MFKIFGNAVRSRFIEMSREALFIVGSDRDTIWEKYLTAFPAGSNPVFRKRTEHDCSCCRTFIRSIGNVVAIQNGSMVSVWDHNDLPSPYREVADAMAAYVKSLPIVDVFLTPVTRHGNEVTHEQSGATVLNWNHFSADVPKKFVTIDHAEKRGDARTTHAVLMRGFVELRPDAVATVVDLIQGNALYRGAEHLRAVLEFQGLQNRLLAAGASARELLGWSMLDSPVARFRNTVIGTLVQDLSDGVDLERAVKSFETKVAPQNYKRPTALITKGMVDAAMKTLAELGLEQALERRHARLSDVSVSSVLFVDNAVRGVMKGGIKDLLMQEVKPAPFDLKKAVEIGVDEFVQKVLPKTNAISLYLDNNLLRNFVSLTAPAHTDSGSLFKWNNDFAWSYDGNVTDTIKDKVKRAGGTVEGVKLRISLAWFNTDDLDLHVREPGGNHVYFGNKSNILDVDMNVRGETRDPVENMRWIRVPRDGVYEVQVHNFTRRESVDVGFVIEVESDHGLETLRFEKAVSSRAYQPVAALTVKNGAVQTMQLGKDIVRGSASRDQWGLKTLDLVRVNSVVLSPNYWDGNAVGNKHWFFILDGCKNPLPARGIYNEFLPARLDKHRKVFEILGDKMKCPVSDEQMSGLGFSSTGKDKVTVIAMGPSLNKPYTIVF